MYSELKISTLISVIYVNDNKKNNEFINVNEKNDNNDNGK